MAEDFCEKMKTVGQKPPEWLEQMAIKDSNVATSRPSGTINEDSRQPGENKPSAWLTILCLPACA